ncbi:MAG: hypothetical protein QW303_07490 [Nitrososphaerota archaeon]
MAVDVSSDVNHLFCTLPPNEMLQMLNDFFHVLYNQMPKENKNMENLKIVSLALNSLMRKQIKIIFNIANSDRPARTCYEENDQQYGTTKCSKIEKVNCGSSISSRYKHVKYREASDDVRNSSRKL